MAKNKSAASTVLLCLILAWASVPASECFERPAPVPAREEDVRLIKCGACKKVAEQLYSYRLYRHQRLIPPHEITVEEIVQITKKTCNLEEEEADSTGKKDTVEQGDKLKLADQGTEGICDAECKTMQEACNEVIKGADLVFDFLNEPDAYRDEIVHYVCRNITTPCTGTLEALRLGEADEDDDKDEDEDTDLASKPGEDLGEDDSRKAGWKPAKGFQTAKEAGKRVAAKGKEAGKTVVAKVKGWWSKKNSKTDKSEL